MQIILIANRGSDLTSCKQSGEPGLVALSVFALASENKIVDLLLIVELFNSFWFALFVS